MKSTLEQIKESLYPLINPCKYISNLAGKGSVNWVAVDKLLSNRYWFIEKAQAVLDILPEDSGSISDGYHTFNELYEHRMHLFAVICNQNKELSWKSKLHHDNTMYDNYFIVGITTPQGNYTYHYHIDHWDMFNVKELDKAPEWDGHKPSDIIRLHSME